MSGLNCSSSKRGVTHKVGHRRTIGTKGTNKFRRKSNELTKNFYLRRYIEKRLVMVLLREERTLTHHHESPATCGRVWSARGRPHDDARGFAHAGCGAARRDCGDLLDGRPESSLARAARTLDPLDDGRPVRRGRLIRRVGPNVRAPGTRARADDARAERELDRDPRRYASGAAAAAVALALLAETCAAPAFASPLGHHDPADSHRRRRPVTHPPATPRATPRPYPVLPHIASARMIESVAAVAAAPAPPPVILAPPPTPDPPAGGRGKSRADLKKETRAQSPTRAG